MWVRGLVDYKTGAIVIEYQPQIKFRDNGFDVLDLNGDVSERFVYGRSLSDVSNEAWKVAGRLEFSLIEGLEVYDVKRKVRAFDEILDTSLMLILLGYGESPQDVLDWFKTPSYGQWVQPGVPYMVRVSELGSSRVEVNNAECSIDGQVTFSVLFLREEVDLTMSWDRFLLASKINVREDFYESI